MATALKRLPPGFLALAESDNSPYAAIGELDSQRYGLQFHPEVQHSPAGADILSNFLFSDLRLPAEMDAGRFH